MLFILLFRSHKKAERLSLQMRIYSFVRPTVFQNAIQEAGIYLTSNEIGP